MKEFFSELKKSVTLLYLIFKKKEKSITEKSKQLYFCWFHFIFQNSPFVEVKTGI